MENKSHVPNHQTTNQINGKLIHFGGVIIHFPVRLARTNQALPWAQCQLEPWGSRVSEVGLTTRTGYAWNLICMYIYIYVLYIYIIMCCLKGGEKRSWLCISHLTMVCWKAEHRSWFLTPHTQNQWMQILTSKAENRMKLLDVAHTLDFSNLARSQVRPATESHGPSGFKPKQSLRDQAPVQSKHIKIIQTRTVLECFETQRTDPANSPTLHRK